MLQKKGLEQFDKASVRFLFVLSLFLLPVRLIWCADSKIKLLQFNVAAREQCTSLTGGSIIQYEEEYGLY
jgi:hypothetical protein